MDKIRGKGKFIWRNLREMVFTRHCFLVGSKYDTKPPQKERKNITQQVGGFWLRPWKLKEHQLMFLFKMFHIKHFMAFVQK